MKVLILVLGCCFALMGCKNPIPSVTCPLEETANGAIASKLNSLAACSNAVAIDAQFATWEAPLNLCPANGKAHLSAISAICIALLPIVEAQVSQTKYLQEFGCDLTKAPSLTVLLQEACAALSPAPATVPPKRPAPPVKNTHP